MSRVLEIRKLKLNITHQTGLAMFTLVLLCPDRRDKCTCVAFCLLTYYNLVLDGHRPLQHGFVAFPS